ncbi:hypothetical protein YC2023_066139 [Brassica napus]
MHLLDKSLTRALPIALMIHDNSTDRMALLVVEPWDGLPGPPLVSTGRLVSSVGDMFLALTGRVVPPDFDPILLTFGIGVMINRDSREHSYFIVKGEILGFMKDKQLRKHLSKMFH